MSMTLIRRFQLDSTDQEYVRYLEDLITQIQRLVLNEVLMLNQPFPPSYPARPGGAGGGAAGAGGSEFAPQPAFLRRSTAESSREQSLGSLRFVHEEPDPDVGYETRWKSHMRKLVLSTPKAQDWHNALTSLGFTPDVHNAMIQSLIQGGAPGAPPEPLNPDAGLLERVSWYANHTTQRPRIIASFQKFLLVCLCIVLEAEGVPEGELNTVMRICISDAQESTLRKIRKGVAILTFVISHLITSGWGSRASLLPLMWRKDPPYFARLSDDARCEGLLIEELSTPDFSAPVTTPPDQNDLPLNIPVVVQQIFAGRVDLRRISLALRMFLVDPTLSPGTVIPVHARSSTFELEGLEEDVEGEEELSEMSE